MPVYVRPELRRKANLPYCVFFINVSRHTQRVHIPVLSSEANTFIFRAWLLSSRGLLSPFAASHVLLLSMLWTRLQQWSWENKFRHHKKKKSRSQTETGNQNKVCHPPRAILLSLSLPAVSQALPPLAPAPLWLTWVAQQPGKAIQEARMECHAYGQWLMNPEWQKRLSDSVLSTTPAWSIPNPLLSKEGWMQVTQQLERTNEKTSQGDKAWAKFWNNISWKMKMGPSAGNRD